MKAIKLNKLEVLQEQLERVAGRSDVNYVRALPTGAVLLDGEFTVTELQAVIVLIEQSFA